MEHFENDTTESIPHLLEHRIPWLFLGLIGGIVTSFIMSHYEEVLASDIRLAFFIPVIVYMSCAVGVQTETIYVRNITKKKSHLIRYLIKESVLGFALGIIFGSILGLFASYWLGSADIGMAVGLTMLINLTIAPVLASLIPALLYKEHKDPALGAGPVVTITQDLISLLVYFFVSMLIIF